jgi:hypothetical protein
VAEELGVGERDDPVPAARDDQDRGLDGGEELGELRQLVGIVRTSLSRRS